MVRGVGVYRDWGLLLYTPHIVILIIGIGVKVLSSQWDPKYDEEEVISPCLRGAGEVEPYTKS